MDKNPTSATVQTPTSNVTGDVWMNPVFNGGGTSRLVVGLVRFTPGARTNWHCHAEATTWLEPVTDERYSTAHTTAGV